MSPDEEKAERLRKLQERRASRAGADPAPSSQTPAARRWSKAPITRAITGGMSVVAFVAVTATMGPVFVDAAESVETVAAPVTTTSWAPPPTSTSEPAAAPPSAPLPPATIIVQVRREYLVDTPAGGPAVAPAPAPRSGASPAPTPAPTVTSAPAVPATTAAPAPPPPPPPPPPTTVAPLSSGS